MSPGEERRDLVVLVADKNTFWSVEGMLSKPARLGIHPIGKQVYVHPKRDPGVFRHCHDFLRPFHGAFRHAMVICDLHGSGAGNLARSEMESDMNARLSQAGWHDRSKAVVIDPELEAWLWSDSPHVSAALGWPQDRRSLDDWLVQNGYLDPGAPKPKLPKEAAEELLRKAGRPRSSSIYYDLAQRVSFDRCSDTAFLEFRETLARWFGRDRG